MNTQASSAQFKPATQASEVGLSQDPSFSFLDVGTQGTAAIGDYSDFPTFSQVLPAGDAPIVVMAASNSTEPPQTDTFIADGDCRCSRNCSCYIVAMLSMTSGVPGRLAGRFGRKNPDVTAKETKNTLHELRRARKAP